MQNGFGTIIVVVDEDGNIKESKIIPRDEWKVAPDYYAEIAKIRSNFIKNYPEPPYRVYEGVADSLLTFLQSYPEISRPMREYGALP